MKSVFVLGNDYGATIKIAQEVLEPRYRLSYTKDSQDGIATLQNTSIPMDLLLIDSNLTRKPTAEAVLLEAQRYRQDIPKLLIVSSGLQKTDDEIDGIIAPLRERGIENLHYVRKPDFLRQPHNLATRVAELIGE